MIALWLSPIYLLLNLYLAFGAVRWLSRLHPAFRSPYFLAVFALCFTALIFSPLPAAFGRGRIKTFFKKISGWWLGTLIYLVFLALAAALFRTLYHLVWGRPFLSFQQSSILRAADGLMSAVALGLMVYGVLNAGTIRRTVYSATIRKSCGLLSLKIALVADLHIGGAVGLRHMRRVCRTIREIQPDLLIFAGDIFDNDFGTIDAPREICAMLKNISVKYGAYACWGNHDIAEVILAGFSFDRRDKDTGSSPEMIRFLKDAGIRMLEDETVLIDGQFYLCGRLDASCEEKSGKARLAPSQIIASLDHSRPILVIDHQPSQLRELADAGVDLDLSGHTHAGQVFPLNLASHLLWKNPCGLLSVGNMTSIVTSGAGVWGPPQRIGTHSEVVEINLKFEAPKFQ